MAIGGAHHAISIDERLASLSINNLNLECCTFKVHHCLRETNAKAYVPGLVAIGHYHHGNDHLSFMEKKKLKFLQRMLQKGNETSATRYITAMREKEEQACQFYADQFPKLSSDEFVKMLVLDGCFIIELFRIYRDEILQSFRSDDDPIFHSFKNDPIFETSWMISGIMCDLLLFENQLPFFILIELSEMREGCNQQSRESTTFANKSENMALLGEQAGKSSKQYVIDSDQKHEICLDESSDFKDVNERIPTRLLDHALGFFSFASELLCKLNVNVSSYVSSANIKHLLGLIHQAMSPSLKEESPLENEKMQNLKDLLSPNENDVWQSLPYATDLQEIGVEFEVAKKLRDLLVGPLKIREEWNLIPNVKELHEAGVKFKTVEIGRNLFHIKVSQWNNGNPTHDYRR